MAARWWPAAILRPDPLKLAMQPLLSVIILTLNEEANLPFALSSLRWMPRSS